MAQRSRPRARFVAVTGLRKSGKTTVAEALISELSSRGYSVGSVKSTRHSTLELDTEGTDTWRHAMAGASVVVALMPEQTVRFEYGRRRRTLAEVRQLFPPSTRFIISEGRFDPKGTQTIILCLKTDSDLEETLKVRGILLSEVLAISGVAAARTSRRKDPAATGALPRFDVRRADQRRALVDLILGGPDQRTAHPDARSRRC